MKILEKKAFVVSLFIIAIVFVFPRCFIVGFDEFGVDEGWIYGIKYFLSNSEHYSWGKNVLYTYGPLGAFSTRDFPEQFWLLQFLIDFYILSQLITIFFDLKNNSQKIIFSIAILAVLWEVNLLLLFYSIYFLIRLNKKTNTFFVVLIAVNCALSVFIKQNTFVICVPLIFTTALQLFILKKWKQTILFLLVVAMVAALIISLFNIHINNYFKYLFVTVSDYGYNMYFLANVKTYNYLIIIAAISFIALIIFSTIKSWQALNKKETYFFVLLYAVVLLYFFILFKQGFTRADRGHFVQFFSLLPLVLFLFFILSFNKIIKYMVVAATGFSVLLSAFTWYKNYNFCQQCHNKLPLYTYFQQFFATLNSPKTYKQNSLSKSIDFLYNACAEKKRYPQYEWHNRVAFQSIVNGSRKIDSINATNFETKNTYSPQYIFIKPDAVDNRNFLWDEPLCFYNILQNYKFQNFENNGVMLVKNYEKTPVLKTAILFDTTIAFNQILSLKNTDTSVLVVNAKVVHNSLGSFCGILFQPPHINLKLIGNTTIDYRYILPLHNGADLIVSHQPKPNDINQFKDIFLNFNRLSSNVKAIQFNNSFGFGVKDSIKLSIKKIWLQSSN